MHPSSRNTFFGLLFIKRMSDEFDKKREQIRKKYSHLDKATVADLLEDKSSYGETFFVPKRARWRESWAMLKPYDPALMEAYAVNRAVNSVKNDTEECIEPAADWSRQR